MKRHKSRTLQYVALRDISERQVDVRMRQPEPEGVDAESGDGVPYLFAVDGSGNGSSGGRGD